jgi:hypothetical protein
MDSVALKDLIIYHSSSEEVNDGLLFLSFMPCLVFALYYIVHIVCRFFKRGRGAKVQNWPHIILKNNV